MTKQSEKSLAVNLKARRALEAALLRGVVDLRVLRCGSGGRVFKVRATLNPSYMVASQRRRLPKSLVKTPWLNVYMTGRRCWGCIMWREIASYSLITKTRNIVTTHVEKT